jgi:phage gp29-like protein
MAITYYDKILRGLSDVYNSWTINVARQGEKTKPNIIVNKLNVQPIQRQSLDIQKWRNALIMAEGTTQQRNYLYELYEDILLDGFLCALMDKRRMAITNLSLTFVKADKPDDALVQLTQTTYFETLLNEILNARFYGHSLVQLDWGSPQQTDFPNRTILIPRKHVKPRFGIVTKNVWDVEGIPYLGMPDVLEIGDREDLGKLLHAAPLVIYKRGDWGDWAEFVEVFGMPIIDASYNNDSTRDALEQAFQNMGSRGRLIRPSDAHINIQTVNDNGTGGNLFDNFRKALNEELAITILGNTMTTTEAAKSGYAQSKTHADSQETLHRDDRKFVLRVLNEKLIPYLRRIGYNTEGGHFDFVDAETLTLTERLDIDLKVSEKVIIGESYWYDKYKIPKPTAAEAKAVEDAETDEDLEIEEENTEGKKKPNPSVVAKKKKPPTNDVN